MYFRSAALTLLALATPASAFVGNTAFSRSATMSLPATADPATADAMDPALSADIRKELNYKAGEADTDFARRYKHLAGAKIKTVGDAFAEFTKALGYTVNPLYKNMVTDIVGTTHLIVVNARFQKDAIWSLGIITALELLLKNYPEPEFAEAIVTALFKCIGMDEAAVRAEAKSITEWAQGKSKSDIEAALSGEGDSPVASIAKTIKDDSYWMYSRYFGIGLLKLMENTGVEMDKDEVYPVMETWMNEKLGRSSITACADSDMYFKIRNKLEMMETMMKEIEIREKKRMAARLEDRAEAALRAADREEQFATEVDAETAASKEKVA